MDVKSPHMFGVDFLRFFGVVATGLIGNAQLADFGIQTLTLSFKNLGGLSSLLWMGNCPQGFRLILKGPGWARRSIAFSLLFI